MNNGGFLNEAYLDDNNTSIPGAFRWRQENGSPLTHTNNSEGFTEKVHAGTRNQPQAMTAASSYETPEHPAAAAAAAAAAVASVGKRENWGNDIEFLMSCIALSVGLGNVWRFPFTALDNGGGAFVIPYLVVLLLVGRPVYYMEMLLGQFSSRGSVKVFDFSPIMRGVGYGQVLGTAIVTTYYATLMALTLHYLVVSFFPTLPWSYCRPEWGDGCIDSNPSSNTSAPSLNGTTVKTSSAEFYFNKIVLREKDSIEDGIGEPSWTLAIALAVSWLVVALIMIKGIKSAGKASYFLALFPYIVLLGLLIRALTLPGAFDGVVYFLKPQWSKLLQPKVWYAAVTQVFFSLAICFGNIIMYASYNRFEHKIYRDVTIVTTLDTFTSLLSGVVIFGILGNLAYESNTTDIPSVVKGGTGLAFISYPDAISKFKFVPQIFSVLFFLMLFVLGIGSNVGMASCILTVVKDKFTTAKHWMVVVCIAAVGYFVGLIYITPGGQYILSLLDFYGASFVALVLAIFELLAVGWIYGVNRFCSDIQFMLGIRTSIYYRLCWGIITPVLMAAILVYTLVEYEPLQYKGHTYKEGLYVFGWCLSAFGIGQLLFWAIYAFRQQTSSKSFWGRLMNAFKPKSDWGPLDPKTLTEYKYFIEVTNATQMFQKNGFWYRMYKNIFG